MYRRISCTTRRPVTELEYCWTIDHFSAYYAYEVGQRVMSGHFAPNATDRNVWCLVLFPSGDSEENVNHTSIHLKLISSDKRAVTADVTVWVVDAFGQKRYEFNFGVSNYLPGDSGCAFGRFLDHRSLKDPLKMLLTEDKLTVVCIVKTFAEPENQLQEPRALISIPDSTLISDLKRLYNSECATDVVLDVQGTEIKAHIAMLKHRSTVFQAMFDSEMSECREKRVEIPDLTPNVVREMLKFIYTDEEPNFEMISPEDLLPAADKYDLPRLKSMCESELCAQLSLDTVTRILLLADWNNCVEMKKVIIDFVVEHLEEVSERIEWRDMFSQHAHLAGEIMRNVVNRIKQMETSESF